MKNTRLALAVLAISLALGVLADVLLKERWGISLSIWIGALAAGLLAAKRIGGAEIRGAARWLLVATVLFGACFAWRDSETLRNLDLIAIAVAAALVISRQTAPLWAPTLSRVARSVLDLAGHCIAGFAHLVARDIDWSSGRTPAIAANARSAAVGLLLAIPLLVLFTALFVKADAAFESLFNSVLEIRVATHLIPIAAGTWIAGSYMRGVLAAQESIPLPPRIWLQLGPMELNIPIALLNVLFATFVALQTRYLFGSAEMVEVTPGMTFSGYARRGFFELVTVALLVLPLLLAADSVHAADRSKRLLRLQSAIMAGFVLCIMASALHRMRLYQAEYGLTELRWYTVAFMIWLAVIFVWFCATVLRDWRALFAQGVVVSGFAGVVILHALNPDAWIARSNLENARAGRRFDPTYFAKLSADAVPTVVAELEVLPEEIQQQYTSRLRAHLESHPDWRSWNYSRARAATALR